MDDQHASRYVWDDKPMLVLMLLVLTNLSSKQNKIFLPACSSTTSAKAQRGRKETQTQTHSTFFFPSKKRASYSANCPSISTSLTGFVNGTGSQEPHDRRGRRRKRRKRRAKGKRRGNSPKHPIWSLDAVPSWPAPAAPAATPPMAPLQTPSPFTAVILRSAPASPPDNDHNEPI